MAHHHRVESPCTCQHACACACILQIGCLAMLSALRILLAHAPLDLVCIRAILGHQLSFVLLIRFLVLRAHALAVHPVECRRKDRGRCDGLHCSPPPAEVAANSQPANGEPPVVARQAVVQLQVQLVALLVDEAVRQRCAHRIILQLPEILLFLVLEAFRAAGAHRSSSLCTPRSEWRKRLRPVAR
eukprot:364003-Chlamydomonas_euryale.AAC.7